MTRKPSKKISSKNFVTSRLSVNQYQGLIKDIEGFYSVAQRGVVKMYWQTGKRIVEVDQKGMARAPHGIHLLDQLSQDLTRRLGSGFSKRNLMRMRQFYLKVPIAPPVAQLTWTQHINLLSIRNPQKRKVIQARVLRKNLSSKEIAALAKQENQANQFLNSKKNQLPLKVTRRKLNTYGLVSKDRVAAPQGSLVLDLGFDLWRFISKGEAQKVTITDTPSYTYQSIVEKIIDGDTLWAQISCGFGCVIRQKLRFRDIDTPEMGTAFGQKAKAFVDKRIPKNSVIVIQTHKNDKYDRYLADIFYLPHSKDPQKILANGKFLNQELLDCGLASKI